MNVLMSGTREGRLYFFDLRRPDKARVGRVNTVRRMRGSIRECADKVQRLFAPPDLGNEGGPEIGDSCVEESVVEQPITFAPAPSGLVVLMIPAQKPRKAHPELRTVPQELPGTPPHT